MNFPAKQKGDVKTNSRWTLSDAQSGVVCFYTQFGDARLRDDSQRRF